MMEQIGSKLQDYGISNEGKPIAGGQPFRKYLLNRVKRISSVVGLPRMLLPLSKARGRSCKGR
jgi:hypothetical protein